MVSLTLRKSKAFSLIELVIVVVIIGIIAAIAIPRMSRGASGANESAFHGNLAMLRKAIELYHAEHDAYPSATTIVAQLTQYTKLDGTTSATKSESTGFIFGPYLRSIPPLTVGTNKGKNGIETSSLGAAGKGWFYDASTGEIKANLDADETDAANADKPWNTY